MANRSYAQINISLKSSKKIKALRSAGARWAYIVAHLADQSNYLGIFTYPRFIWAYDANLAVDELEGVIADLEDVGLVEYDRKEELIRIVGWFRKKNAPENGSRAKSLIKGYQSSEIPAGEMLMRSIAEFSVGTVKRGINWESDWGRLRETFGPFLKQIKNDNGTYFLDAILAEARKVSCSVISELNYLLPSLEERKSELASTGCRDTTLDETRRDQHRIIDQNKIIDKTNTLISESKNEPNNAGLCEDNSAPVDPNKLVIHRRRIKECWLSNGGFPPL